MMEEKHALQRAAELEIKPSSTRQQKCRKEARKRLIKEKKRQRGGAVSIEVKRDEKER